MVSEHVYGVQSMCEGVQSMCDGVQSMCDRCAEHVCEGVTPHNCRAPCVMVMQSMCEGVQSMS